MTVFLYNNICHTYSRVEFRDVEWLSTFIAAECENVSNFRRVGQTKFSKHLTISALGGINLCPFPSHRSLSVLPQSPVNMSVCAFTGVLASGVQRLLWTEASRNSRKPPEHHHVIHYISILLCHTYLMASIYLTVQCASISIFVRNKNRWRQRTIPAIESRATQDIPQLLVYTTINGTMMFCCEERFISG